MRRQNIVIFTSAMIAVLGATIILLLLLCAIRNMQLLLSLTMCFINIVAISWIVLYSIEKGNTVKTLIQLLIIDWITIIITALIIYLTFTSYNIGRLIMINCIVSVALVSVGIIAGYFASILHKKTSASKDKLKKIDTFDFVYFVMFTALLLLLVFAVGIKISAKEYVLNGNSINAMNQIIAMVSICIIFALAIIMPVFSILIIKSIKRDLNEKSSLNNICIYIPLISFIICVIIQFFVTKNFSLWILFFISPALVSTVFNKLLVDDSKNFQ